MIWYQYTFQAGTRKIITRQKSDFFQALGSQFPLQRPTEKDEITTENLNEFNHASQTMQTLCSIEMTAITEETIEKCEDGPVINACLGEIDVQNTTNCKGMAGIFLKGYDINSIKNFSANQKKLMIFCKKK